MMLLNTFIAFYLHTINSQFISRPYVRTHYFDYTLFYSFSVMEHVVSNQAQPHAHSERAQSEMRGAVLRALNTLPEDESRAIHERLGLGDKHFLLFSL